MSVRQNIKSFGPGDAKIRVASETHAIALTEPTAEMPLAVSGTVIQPPTVQVQIDPVCGLAAMYMRTPEGQEFLHPLGAERCVKLAYDLLLAASRSMMPPGLMLAINALKGSVFARSGS
jgi:hypothetical protein